MDSRSCPSPARLHTLSHGQSQLCCVVDASGCPVCIYHYTRIGEWAPKVMTADSLERVSRAMDLFENWVMVVAG